MTAVRRVVFLKPCCIGDAVMSLPVIDSLAAALPDAIIDIWTGNHSRPVYEHHPSVRAIASVPDVPRLFDIPRLQMDLRSSGADALLILDRSRLLEQAGRFSGIGTIASVPRFTPATTHESDCYLATLQALDIPPAVTKPILRLDPRQRKKGARSVAHLDGPFVVLHPGGAENPGARMHTKRWPVEHWIEVADWLVSRAITPTLTGSENERSLCLAIAARSTAGIDGVTILAGELGLMESAAVIERATAYVGPDTGISHLAAATGTPTVAIFGPTNPHRYAPRGKRVVILAPPAAWDVPDTDLRGRNASMPIARTRDVAARGVITALEDLLSTTNLGAS